MKKHYYKPALVVNVIKTESLLVVLSGEPADDVTAGTREMDPLEEEAQSRRRRTVWEDEELEEEEYEDF